MKPNPTNHTHVRRASSGLTLIEIIVISGLSAIAFVIIMPALLKPSQTPYDVISRMSEARHQQDVVIRFITPDGNAVVEMEKYGSRSIEDFVWLDYRILEYSRASGQRVWKTYGHPLKIKLAGEMSVGEKVGLYYVFSVKKLRSGEWYEEVESVEVRPLAKRQVVPFIKLK